MFKLLLVFTGLTLSQNSYATNLPISTLPLGTGSAVGSSDSFPYTNVGAGQPYRLVLDDLVNIPAFQTEFTALVPMTTLGDLIYENATPAPARLAGNITTTEKFLCQTGTGSVSAAPAWCALVSGNIPNNAANTTGTAGGLTQTLMSGAPVIGNGTGVTVGTASGNTTVFGTTSGTLTSGDCVDIDSHGNLVDSGVAGCGGTLTFADSLVNTTGTVALKNDSATPGASKYYGTNSGSTLGYFALPTGFSNPMTTAGDLMFENATPAAARLPIGSSTNLLTISGGLPAWEAIPTWNQNTTGTAASFTGNLTGDVISSGMATTVVKINGTSLAGLATGVLKNTTTTGVPSIATYADIVAMFSTCSGTQYLGADGNCHTPSSSAITALTGGVTASGTGSVVATVVTNANLTGPITSSGNATSIASQTGTGSTFVMSAGPTITGTLAGASETLSSTLVATGAISGSNLTSGGHASADLQASNNLSDVGTKATAFNNVSPMTTLGDTLYGGASGAGTRLAGNITTVPNVLTQTGTGSVSAAPVWTPVSAIGISTDTTTSLSFTPNSGAFGSIVNPVYSTYRSGDRLFFDIQFSNGTASSGTASLALPSGLTIKSGSYGTSLPTVVGSVNLLSGTNSLWIAGIGAVAFYDGSDTSNIYIGYQAGSSTTINKVTGTGMSGNGNSWEIKGSVAISQWSSSTIGSGQGAVYAQYFASANNNVSSSQSANYDTKVQDTGCAGGTCLVTASAAGTGTWKFTAPVSGSYTVQVWTYLTTTPNTTGYIYKNGSLLQPIQLLTSSAQQGAATFNLVAGDYIDFRTGSSITESGQASLSANAPSFSISLNSGNGSGNVSSSSLGQEHIERALIAAGSRTTACSSGTCTLYDNTPGITSSTYNGATGNYVVNFVAGTFSGNPVCTCTNYNSGGFCYLAVLPSSSSFQVQNESPGSGGTNINAVVGVICQGPH